MAAAGAAAAEPEAEPAGGGSAAGSQARRAKPSAAAASQPAQRSWPAVGDEVEADWSGEGEWFDGRVTRARGRHGPGPPGVVKRPPHSTQ